MWISRENICRQRMQTKENILINQHESGDLMAETIAMIDKPTGHRSLLSHLSLTLDELEDTSHIQQRHL